MNHVGKLSGSQDTTATLPLQLQLHYVFFKKNKERFYGRQFTQLGIPLLSNTLNTEPPYEKCLYLFNHLPNTIKNYSPIQPSGGLFGNT